ncbi:hypothetical protein OH77DRAFT_1420696 [Trametes cingulata]|nr:hypothetical protein OH77DRAFT_1420696 [Trametes cingulata]
MRNPGRLANRRVFEVTSSEGTPRRAEEGGRRASPFPHRCGGPGLSIIIGHTSPFSSAGQNADRKAPTGNAKAHMDARGNPTTHRRSASVRPPISRVGMHTPLLGCARGEYCPGQKLRLLLVVRTLRLMGCESRIVASYTEKSSSLARLFSTSPGDLYTCHRRLPAIA